MAANLLVKLSMDTSRMAGELDKIDNKLSGFGKSMTRVGGLVAGAFAGGEILSFANDAANAASDLNETLNKSQVIFGDAAEKIRQFGLTAAKSIGQSQRQAVDAAATFGVFGKAAGLSGNGLADFSTKLTVLASDLASFSNTTPEQAIEALGAALRGESEPIRKYGVLLDDATLKAKAMALGIYDGTGALTPQQRVLAAYNTILDQTTSAQGDFARTADGAANKSRILNARFEDLKATIGDKLLPIKMRLLEIGGRLIDWFQRLDPNVQKAIIIIGVLVVAVAGLTVAVGALAVAVNAATWPVLLVIALIALLIAGFILAYNNIEPFRNAVDAVAEFFTDTLVPALQDGYAWLKEKLGPVFAEVADFIREKWEKFKAWWDENWPGIKQSLMEAAERIREKWEKFKGWWEENWPRIRIILHNAIEGIKTIIQGFIDFVDVIWSLWGDDIVNVVAGAWQMVSNIIDGIINYIGGVISFWLAVLSGDWEGAWNALRETTEELLDNLRGVIEGGLRVVRGIVGGAFDFIRTVAGEAFDFILSLPGRLLRLGAMLAEVLGNAAKAGVNALISVLESGINAAIRGANSLTKRLPLGMDFTIPEVQIPRLAKGGIVTAPTLALIGEAGPEAVVPLNKAGNGLGGGNNYQITVNVAPGANPVDTGRAIVDAIKAYERSNSGSWRGAA